MAKPVLSSSASPVLSSIIENAGIPTGAVGTLVSDLIDTGSSGNNHNNFLDGDGDSPGIAITGANLEGGTLYYSIDNGTNWIEVGEVSESSAKVLYANSDTRLAFVPASEFSGTISDLITFKAWDRTGGGIKETPTSVYDGQYSDFGGHYRILNVDLSPDGNHLYVADQWGELKIIDVADPSNPSLADRDSSRWLPAEVVISDDGNFAYVGGRGGFTILDVTDPSEPTRVGVFGIHHEKNVNSIAISPDGNTAYLSAQQLGTKIVDISDPTSPQEIATIPTSGITSDVAVTSDGNYLFAVDGGNRYVQIVDLSTNTETGRLVGIEGWARDVSISPSGEVFAGTSDGITHFGNLSSLNYSGDNRGRTFINTSGSGRTGNFVFTEDGNHIIAAARNGLTIVDISDTSNFSVSSYVNSNISGGNGSLDVVLSPDGTKAYIGTDKNGVQIVEISEILSNGQGSVDTNSDSFSDESDTVGIDVQSANNSPEGSVLISGTLKEGNQLTASNTITDDDGLGTISYQWNRNGTAIDGATEDTYVLTYLDVDDVISVNATYTDGAGNLETVESSSTTDILSRDENLDGLDDNYTYHYAIVNGADNVNIVNGRGRPRRTNEAAPIIAAAPSSSGSGWEVLLSGNAPYEGRYKIGFVNSSGVLSKRHWNKPWLDAQTMVNNGYEDFFNKDLNNDGITGTPIIDGDNDGLRDIITSRYDIYDDGSALTIKNKRGGQGQVYSDSSSEDWDITDASSIEGTDNWQVLLTGTGTYSGLYKVGNVLSDGYLSKKVFRSRWMNTETVVNKGFETVFNQDLNNDGIVGTPVVDSDNDGLRDIVTSKYDIYNGGSPITIMGRNGRPLAPTNSPLWDITDAKSIDGTSDWHVLFTGESRRSGQFQIGRVASDGTVMSKSRWQSGISLFEKGFESVFNKDFNGDEIIGTPIVDNDSDGMRDIITSHYDIYDDGEALTITNLRGKSYSDATSADWDITDAKAIDGTGQWSVLMTGTGDYDGKYKVGRVKASGALSNRVFNAAWMTSEDMSNKGYESVFNIDFNSDGNIV